MLNQSFLISNSYHKLQLDVPAPVIDWEPKALDYDLLMSGLIYSFEMSATNRRSYIHISFPHGRHRFDAWGIK